MAIARVQGGVNQEGSGSGQATLAVALTGVTAANAIVVGVKWQGGAAVNVTVSDGTTTLTPLTERLEAGTDTSGQLFLLPSSAGGSVTLTATFSGAGGTYPRIFAQELSGSGITVDVEAGQGQSSTSAVSSGNLALTAPAMVVALYAESDVPTLSSPLVGGVAADGSANSEGYATMWWRWVATPATVAATATLSFTSSFAVTAVALKEGSATTVTQAGFRLYDDDAAEASTTPLAGQNVNAHRLLNVRFLTRLLLQAAGDPAGYTFRFEYAKNGGGWSQVLASQPSVVPPTAVSKGAFTSGTAGLSVPYGTHAVGDLAVLVVNSANETIATPSGWTQVTNSPQSQGTAAAAGGNRVAVFTRITTSGSTANQAVADAGNYTTAQIFIVRGFDPTTPIHITTGSTGAASSTFTAPGVTTTLPQCLILHVIGLDNDLADTDTLSGATNANLTSLTEWHDQTVASGVGGGLAVLHGVKATTGATGNTTGSSDTSVNKVYVTLAIAPAPVAQVPVLLAASPNIAAGGGAATTQKLGGTGTFLAGRRSDDTNPLASLDLASDGNTEVEFAALLVTGESVDTDTFDFRVTNNGAPLSSYAATPRVTVGVGGGSTSILRQMLTQGLFARMP